MKNTLPNSVVTWWAAVVAAVHIAARTRSAFCPVRTQRTAKGMALSSSPRLRVVGSCPNTSTVSARALESTSRTAPYPAARAVTNTLPKR